MTQQGKWGWYPCNIEVYHKLKAINLAYDNALHQMKTWQRWNRKDPKNRVSRKKLKDSNGQVVGYGIAEPIAEPEICPIFSKKNKDLVKMIENSVYEDYRKARYPVGSEAEVLPLSINLAKIDKLYSAIKDR
jgi:hypothetical protein